MFDLDGTITRRDTLFCYLLGALRAHPARVLRLWVVPGALVAFAFDRDHGRFKGRVIRAALGGLSRGEIAGLTGRFLDGEWRHLVRPGAVAALERHRLAGDYLVLLSASTECYVPAIGARLGFDEVVCTELRWDGERLDGALASPNRRGPEKTRCIERLTDAHPGLLVTAYADAASDLDHLRLVEHGVLVNGSWRARREARAAGLACVDWD
ncbi:MAG TPA: HAD-IB family phosphatase [Steroidobacteraceae bacterium]|nr:HAD-IB family phosphatase [Steroidobacteraceae bacterium]